MKHIEETDIKQTHLIQRFIVILNKGVQLQRIIAETIIVNEDQIWAQITRRF